MANRPNSIDLAVLLGRHCDPAVRVLLKRALRDGKDLVTEVGKAFREAYKFASCRDHYWLIEWRDAVESSRNWSGDPNAVQPGALGAVHAIMHSYMRCGFVPQSLAEKHLLVLRWLANGLGLGWVVPVPSWKIMCQPMTGNDLIKWIKEEFLPKYGEALSTSIYVSSDEVRALGRKMLDRAQASEPELAEGLFTWTVVCLYEVFEFLAREDAGAGFDFHRYLDSLRREPA